MNHQNPEPISAQCFKELVGQAPVQDDLERTNCARAGMPGHSQCGMCPDCIRPRFVCGHTARSDSHEMFSEPGIIETLASELYRSEDTGQFDNEGFLAAMLEARSLLDQIEERGCALADKLQLRTETSLLIVEDEPAMRRAIERMAHTLGFTRVTACRSIEQLREELASSEWPAQVVLSDYDLPDGTGDDVQRLVLHHACEHRAPQPMLIAHSANREQLARMLGYRVLKGGSDGPDALQDVLRFALHRSRQESEARARD